METLQFHLIDPRLCSFFEDTIVITLPGYNIHNCKERRFLFYLFIAALLFPHKELLNYNAHESLPSVWLLSMEVQGRTVSVFIIHIPESKPYGCLLCFYKQIMLSPHTSSSTCVITHSNSSCSSDALALHKENHNLT